MTLPASVRGFNLKNHEELKKKSQLIEKWRRFSLGVVKTTPHPTPPHPGTDRVKSDSNKQETYNHTDILLLAKIAWLSSKDIEHTLQKLWKKL